MNRSLWIAAILLGLLLTATQGSILKKLFPGDEGDAPTGKASMDDEIAQLKQQEFKNMKGMEDHQNKAWACYFLVKDKIREIEKEQIQSSPSPKKMRKALTSDMYQRCLGVINPEEARSVIDKLRNSQPLPSEDYEVLIRVKTDKYKDIESYTMTDTQDLIYRYYQDLDLQVKRMNGDDDEDEDEPVHRKYDIEPKIAGISLTNLPLSMKMVYFGIVLFLVAIAFYFAYRKLFIQKHMTAYEKAVNEKKKKKSTNPRQFQTFPSPQKSD